MNTTLSKLSEVAANMGAHWPDDPADPEPIRRIKWLTRQVNAATPQQATLPASEPVALTEEQREEVLDVLRNTYGIEGDLEQIVSVVADVLAGIPLFTRAQPQADAAEPVARFAEVFAELERATTKFPTWPTDPLHAMGVLAEEFGELGKDVLQLVYEPHKTSRENVRKEATQTAAMALRFFASLDRYEYMQGAQHSQAEQQAQAPGARGEPE